MRLANVDEHVAALDGVALHKRVVGDVARAKDRLVGNALEQRPHRAVVALAERTLVQRVELSAGFEHSAGIIQSAGGLYGGVVGMRVVADPLGRRIRHRLSVHLARREDRLDWA